MLSYPKAYRFRPVSLADLPRARDGECELGTLAIGKTVSGTDFGNRMGVVTDSSRNPLSTRSMWRATGAGWCGVRPSKDGELVASRSRVRQVLKNRV